MNRFLINFVCNYLNKKLEDTFMKNVLALFLISGALFLVSEKGKLASVAEVQNGTINIVLNCSPKSGYTCKLYNCDGTWTGKQCGPTDINGKCGVENVPPGCYFFVIDNGSQTCSGQQFNFSFPFLYHYFNCGSNCNPYGPEGQ